MDLASKADIDPEIIELYKQSFYTEECSGPVICVINFLPNMQRLITELRRLCTQMKGQNCMESKMVASALQELHSNSWKLKVSTIMFIFKYKNFH